MTADVVRFDALRNALYHTARVRWYSGWNRLFNFIILFLGTAAAADAAKLFPLAVSDNSFARAVGCLTAAVGALQLVIDFGGSARTHESLARRYYELMAEIEETPLRPREETVRAWRGKLIRITADEPPTLRALDSIAYNEAADALGWAHDDRLIVPWHQRIRRHISAFKAHRYETLKERRARLAKSDAPANKS